MEIISFNADGGRYFLDRTHQANTVTSSLGWTPYSSVRRALIGAFYGLEAMFLDIALHMTAFVNCVNAWVARTNDMPVYELQGFVMDPQWYPG